MDRSSDLAIIDIDLFALGEGAVCPNFLRIVELLLKPHSNRPLLCSGPAVSLRRTAGFFSFMPGHPAGDWISVAR